MDNWTSAIINGLNGQKHVHRSQTMCGTMSSRRVTIRDETFDATDPTSNQ